MNVTNDLSQFGIIQLDEAKILLDHVKEADSNGKLELQFNTSSGNVFLVDEDYRVWMMNGDDFEEFFHALNVDTKDSKKTCNTEKTIRNVRNILNLLG